MDKKARIGILGAGASGMAAAIAAAGCGAEVTLFEKEERVGRKILATGNGKCNLGNLDFSVNQYYCEDKEKLEKMFRVFSVWDTISFFESMGLMVKSKNGYLYPYCEQASAVLDVLRMELSRKQVRVVTNTAVESAVYRSESGVFELTDGFGAVHNFQKLIVACGSPASLKKGEGMTGYRLAESFGHKVKRLLPGLVQLRSDEAFVRALAGVRCQAKVTLLTDGEEQAAETGEVQFTDYGVSGIPVFQLSRIGAAAVAEKKKVEVILDFFPDQEEKAYVYMARQRFELQQDKTLEEYMTGLLNKKINMVLIKRLGLKPDRKAAETGWQKISALMQECRRFPIHISSANSMENAQVCAGGIGLEQISTEMESELVKGLYFTGELLDIDGRCGGYNLQWAFTSGVIAGRNAAGCSTRAEAEGSEPENEQLKGGPKC